MRLHQDAQEVAEEESFHHNCFTEGRSIFRLLATECNRPPALALRLLVFLRANRMDTEQIDSHYRVEVSGWDVAESFFVEKVTLELTQAGERVVHLKHPLRAGLIVFLRLIESRIEFPVLPVAYQVMGVAPGERDEVHRVSIKKLRRHRTSQESEASAAGAIELL